MLTNIVHNMKILEIKHFGCSWSRSNWLPFIRDHNLAYLAMCQGRLCNNIKSLNPRLHSKSFGKKKKFWFTRQEVFTWEFLLQQAQTWDAIERSTFCNGCNFHRLVPPPLHPVTSACIISLHWVFVLYAAAGKLPGSEEQDKVGTLAVWFRNFKKNCH